MPFIRFTNSYLTWPGMQCIMPLTTPPTVFLMPNLSRKKSVIVIKHSYAVVCIPRALSPPRNTINTSCYSKRNAGEWIDSILDKRSASIAPPIIMSDALGSNRPTVTKTMTSLCHSHARRQFVDVINHFPEEVAHILTRYGEIWRHDHHIAQQQMSLSERLEYHRTHSLPVMAEIKLWDENHPADETVEANSGLGKAIRYFIKHYEGLSLFCQEESAKLDNNAIEVMLKIVVRDRKNAMFHKTLLGATIGDVITSMIATGSEAGVNVMDYFTLLQREQEQVKAHPENYLPWSYLENS